MCSFPSLSKFPASSVLSPSILTECQRRPETLPRLAGPGGWNSSCRTLLYEERLRMWSSVKRMEEVRGLCRRGESTRNKHLSPLTHIHFHSFIGNGIHITNIFTFFFLEKKKHTRSHTSTLHLSHMSSHSLVALWFGVASSNQWDRRLNLPPPPPRPLSTWM